MTNKRTSTMELGYSMLYGNRVYIYNRDREVVGRGFLYCINSVLYTVFNGTVYMLTDSGLLPLYSDKYRYGV